MRQTQADLPRNEWIDVETRVVDVDRCCSCGVCEVVCPVKDCITISFNENKEYKPSVNHDTCINCSLCLQVCPDDVGVNSRAIDRFLEERPGLIADPIVGSHMGNYIGHAYSERTGAASGGILTALLRHLLRTGLVDGIITAVERAPDRDHVFFEAGIVTTEEELLRNGGSKYYQIEHSKVLDFVDANEGNFAVVALPCTILAMRKAQVIRPRLRRRIKYMFALTCGHNVGANYTDYLIESNGINLDQVKSIKYRDKVGTSTANDFNFAVEHATLSGEVETKRLSFFGSNVGITWYNHMFSMNKCLYCTDLFGELADASFSDAWLPEYFKDVKGTSLVTIRNAEIDIMLRDLVTQGRLELNPIAAERVVEAQKPQVEFKTSGVAERVALQRLFDKSFPFYGTEGRQVSLLKAFVDQFPVFYNVRLSKVLYRSGILKWIGTRAFQLPLRVFRFVGKAVLRLRGVGA